MRLFVAIDLPDSVKDQLAALQVTIPTARWVRRDQMHLTLFFIGETTAVDIVKNALSGIHAKPFILTMSGVGRFPQQSRRPPRVLWVGVDKQPALLQLQQQITTVLTAAGCQADDRAYSPHITLARFKADGPLPAVDTFIEANRHLRTSDIHVSEFVLFSSKLTPQGARYRREAVYTLDPA